MVDDLKLSRSLYMYILMDLCWGADYETESFSWVVCLWMIQFVLDEHANTVFTPYDDGHVQGDQKVFVHLTFCIVIIRCTETFLSPCIIKVFARI